MEFFSGNIADALQQAFRTQSNIIIVVEDESPASQSMAAIWNDHAVWGPVLSSAKKPIIALRLRVGSIEATQFAETQKINVVPSVFFVNASNGQLLEVIEGACSADHIQSRVAFHNGINLEEQATASSSSGTESLEDSIRRKHQEERKKVLAAQELLRKRREEREKQEAEDAEKREIERRKASKLLLEAKEAQKETQAKVIVSEIARQKEEDRKAKEAILAKIAADKESRARKSASATQPAPSSPPPAATASTTTTASTTDTPAATKTNANTSRVAFRLPNGTVVKSEFNADDLFQSAVDFLLPNLTPAEANNYSLRLSHPPRNIEFVDYSTTFRALGLVPIAQIVVISGASTKPGSAATQQQQHQEGKKSNPCEWLMALIWSFFPTNNPTASTASQSSTSGPTDASSSTPTPINADRTAAALRQRRPQASTGKVRTLAEARKEQEEEEEKKRKEAYNGNSVNLE